jgi:hypothetical protein
MATHQTEKKGTVEFLTHNRQVIRDPGIYQVNQASFVAAGTRGHHAHVSRRHLEFLVIHGSLFLRAHVTTNGTYLNGHIVEPDTLVEIDLTLKNRLSVGQSDDLKIGIREIRYKTTGVDLAKAFPKGTVKIYWIVLGADSDPIEVEVKVEVPPEPSAPGPQHTLHEGTVRQENANPLRPDGGSPLSPPPAQGRGTDDEQCLP